MIQVRILLMILCYGFHHVSLKNIFVSHGGQDEDNCGNWTLPCHSVRHAVNISSDNDVIYIDYAEGKPYKECEHPKKNHAIMLNKSLSFYGFNGRPSLHCEKTYPFFEINRHSTPKIVFSNLSLTSRGIILFTPDFVLVGGFELEFEFCDINKSLYFVKASASSCSIHLANCNIRSDFDPINLRCTFLTTRLTGSTFFSCSVQLTSDFGRGSARQPFLNVNINNCTFTLLKRQPSCDSFVSLYSSDTDIANITIASSVFSYFYNLKALGISTSLELIQVNIVLDGIVFEHIYSDSEIVHMDLGISSEIKLVNVGIFNSVFVNTTRALSITLFGYSDWPLVVLHNNTFSISRSIFGKEGPVSLNGGLYHFSSCRFFQHVPVYNPEFPLIRLENEALIAFENCSYESYLTEASLNGNLSNGNMFYVISSKRYFYLVGYFTISCPQGYMINFYSECFFIPTGPQCVVFTALCVQCPRKTYSLERGEVHNTNANHITCHDCPVGGDCMDGQVTSKPNFWGYKSNQTVTFLQCPPKYCCDTDHCKTYHSCHGNRMGTLCGKCFSGMSESLFDTKCKANKDCTSLTFWPAISAFLILYLLFFLYQEDIINFVLRHITPRYIWCFRNGQNFNSGGLLKILFYYYQVVHLLSTSVGSDVKVQFVDDIENFLSRAFSFLIIAIPSIDCPFQDLRPVQKAIIVHSVGYSLLALLCLLYLSIFVFKIFKKLRARSTQQAVAAVETMDYSSNSEDNPFLGRIAGAFTDISLLTYALSTHLCLSLLHCVPVGDNLVLFLDGNVKCHQTFQYFFLAYMISSILPFCFVPVLGSYLLKLNRISVTQFCLACVIPLPFCCYWSYLLVRNCSWWTRHSRGVETSYQIQDDARDENSIASTTTEQMTILSGNSNSETENPSTETELRGCKHAVLSVLLGPFRQHKAIFIFPASHLPWEGFLILRRLVLILVVTFVYDTRVKATLSMIVCAVILLPHVFVKPFKSASDNVVETLSLVMLIVISGFGLIESIYYGEDLDSGSKSLLNMIKVIENVLKIFPIVLVCFLVMFCILLKLTIVFRRCFQAIFRRLRFFKRTNQRSLENCTSEEQQSLLSS